MRKYYILLKHSIKGIVAGVVLAAVFAFVGLQWMAFFAVPDEVVLLKGGSAKVSVDFLGKNFLGVGEYIPNDEKIAEVSSGLVKAVNVGKSKIRVMAFGAIPLKTVDLEVVNKDTIYPSGKIIGMRIKTTGLVVVGTDIIKSFDGVVDLAKENDIVKGDVILKINNKNVDSAKSFAEQVRQSNGESMVITIQRGTEKIEKKVTPVLSSEDDKYHMGIWIRDGITGLGTLTFVTGNGEFGTLGHGLMDADTKKLLPVEKGEVYNAEVLGIKKSAPNDPGEIKGVITDGKSIGNVYINSQQGVYGKMFEDQWKNELKGYTPAQRYEIKEGPAEIISALDGNKIERYSVDITNINTGSPLGVKGFVVKLTDSRLLDKAGGIVQGMSGSPVIQNNKIIGAVTHVIVDDPTKGYGVFIDSMLKQCAAVDGMAINN